MTSDNDSSKDPSDSLEGPGAAPGAAGAAPTAPAAVPTAGQDEQPTQAGQPVYHTSRVYGGPKRPPTEPKKSRRTVVAAIAGVLAVALAAAVLVITVFKPGGSTSPPAYGMIPTGTTAQQDGQQVAAAFLAAWRTGDLAKAANLTSEPAAAKQALAAYAKDLSLKKMTAAPSGVTAATGSTVKAPRESVQFAIGASVGAGSGKNAVRGKWTYHSTLVAYQQPNSQVWFVAWRPDVLAPNLTAATHLAAVTVPPTVSMVTDASGQDLTKYNDAGLSTIAGLLKATAPAQQGASAGLNVEIQTKSGKPVPNSQALIVSPGNYPTLGTTIDAKAESLARKAVGMHKQSSMVVIQPSTGKILAIANNAGFNDFALTADVAPGSTMKVITSTALFNNGMTPQSPVACPAAYTVTGITYHNDQGETLPAGTPFVNSFAQSCNNAFSTQWQQLSGKLASTAKTYYGLNQKWNIGIGDISASYFNAPASASGSELAQEAFGEGSLVASPIAMASVAATVDTGTFKQPYLRLGTKQLTATRLPVKTDRYLKQVMRAVVTSGTGAGLGFGPNVYAKTGTADIQGQDQPNSWMVAFDTSKDVAVACLVVNAGYGAQFAGPEAASFLKGY
ncbi:penicillin-binding protein [Trebonia kvetii]|uniref:Penicillin-binding protein n=1 Tax=Trebonia kvetii TaxID=2480626 RepID=A0A6P2BY63_9ACTN|nr:penicillin-binding transpeptidase domain-containing protein [Trebonia kvetii]TVZ04089.1 penicillin-binding protein [Trebonia kvetii]